jgi:SAM-dependent methyltransferase
LDLILSSLQSAHKEAWRESILITEEFSAFMYRTRTLPITLLFLVGILQSLFSFQLVFAQPQTAQGDQRKTSEPYTGDLSIFESPGREDRLQINRVMDLLGVTQGKSVADIGAGSGWFTVRAAKRVGAPGTVYAVDINPEAIHYIGERAKKEQLENIKPILSKPDDPLLPAASVDAVLMLKTYHEIARPIVLMQNLLPALRPGAKVGVIDRNGNGEDHGIGKQIVINEAKKAGYKLVDQYDFVKADKMDYFLVFTPAR